MLGLAPGHWFRFERLAINQNEPYLDNDNNRPSSSVIVPGGIEQIKSTLPLDWLFEQMQNLPNRLNPEIRPSDNAGGYLCNHVYYHAMHSFENSVPWRGFIHVPSYPIGDPSSTSHISEPEIIEIGLFLVERFSYWLSSKQRLS
jgi:pyroglutamyl-peptidase